MYNQVHCGEAATVMARMPADGIDLIATSPGYWQSDDGSSYESYLDGLQAVWSQCARVLRPNGKLCINTPIMPIPKAVIQQHTRQSEKYRFRYRAADSRRDRSRTIQPLHLAKADFENDVRIVSVSGQSDREQHH
jgi:DNA modification methylase